MQYRYIEIYDIVSMGSFNQILDENATCRDMFEYFFDLSPADVAVLYSLDNGAGECLDDIALKMKKDRTTVFRSLQRLVGTGIVRKKKNVMEKGGYYYLYYRISKTKINELINKREGEFHAVLQCLLRDMDNDFKQ